MLMSTNDSNLLPHRIWHAVQPVYTTERSKQSQQQVNASRNTRRTAAVCHDSIIANIAKQNKHTRLELHLLNTAELKLRKIVKIDTFVVDLLVHDLLQLPSLPAENMI
ncbi:hypothetical protein AVEN_46261-1 [Araneus ventricosus]|uniref:Uncharacterized protein n=1 Tax=Araneus ventricosus TaxID=182803 RepID=A0A4Y2F8T9_ARAVE|nr:hypothetical protein AVEN_46261-1 [Araneus ventricosus]